MKTKAINILLKLLIIIAIVSIMYFSRGKFDHAYISIAALTGIFFLSFAAFSRTFPFFMVTIIFYWLSEVQRLWAGIFHTDDTLFFRQTGHVLLVISVCYLFYVELKKRRL